jgi:hypothetical protein
VPNLSRRRLLLFVPVAVAAVLALGAWVFWPCTAITRENAAKITEGMTVAEVEALLGGPARDETTGPVVLERDGDPDDVQQRAAIYEHLLVESLRNQAAGVRFPQAVEWHSNNVSILVHFNREGCVTDCNSMPRRRANESSLAMLRRWLRL